MVSLRKQELLGSFSMHTPKNRSPTESGGNIMAGLNKSKLSNKEVEFSDCTNSKNKKEEVLGYLSGETKKSDAGLGNICLFIDLWGWVLRVPPPPPRKQGSYRFIIN